jgi:hypothetical protein
MFRLSKQTRRWFRSSSDGGSVREGAGNGEGCGGAGGAEFFDSCHGNGWGGRGGGAAAVGGCEGGG